MDRLESPEPQPSRPGDPAEPRGRSQPPGGGATAPAPLIRRLGLTWWAALVLLIGLTAAVRPAEPFAIDRSASLAVRHLVHPAGLPLPPHDEYAFGVVRLWRAGDVPTALAKLVSIPGNDVGWTIASLLAVVLVMVLAGRRRLGLTLLAIDAAATLTNQVFQHLRARLRPTTALMPILSHTSNRSFPSGHTVHYTVVCCFVIGWLARAPRPRAWLRAVLMALAALLLVAIGWSRLYLGAHWITDVLAGYLYGYLWFRLGAAILEGW